MTFRFIKSYYRSSENFKMEIPVSFVVPKIFRSFDEMGILGSKNKEVCDILTSLGVTRDVRHQFVIRRDFVGVNIRNPEFDNIKKMLLRNEKLKELGI